MACRDGMQYAWDRSVRNLIVETDCQILVKLWEKRSMQRSEVDPILHQMADLSRSFEGFSLCFISQICNRLAHECARLVNHEQPVVEWLITLQVLRA
jgi:ribonuclease HI